MIAETDRVGAAPTAATVLRRGMIAVLIDKYDLGNWDDSNLLPQHPRQLDESIQPQRMGIKIFDACLL